MSNALVTMADMQSAAVAMVKSKLFGFETVEQAMSIMLIAQAEGRSPALAARDYHVIKGRPALKADAMLARFQSEGGVVEWVKYEDSVVTGKFSHPKSCPVPVAVTWTIDMAKRIGLAGRDNWRNYPRAMLRSRVISEGVRTTYPGIAVGLYSLEEVQDMQKEKDITPTAGAGSMLSEDDRVKVTDLADKMREWLNQGSLTDAWMELDNAELDAESQIYLWTHFDARVRRQLKEEGERQRLKSQSTMQLESRVITSAQHKRLEAMIAEKKLDREEIKEFVSREYGKDHFTDLSAAEYETVCGHIESAPPPSSPPPPSLNGEDSLAVGADPSTAAPDANRTLDKLSLSTDAQESATTRDYRAEIKDALGFASKSLTARFELKLKGRKVDDLSDSAAKTALEFLTQEMDKENA